MIPRTYLSTFASNGQQQMRVYFLSSVAGLKRWADYIPVKLTQGGKENSYDNNGFIDVEVVGRSATSVPFKDYVPVYADSSASDAWQVNATGYIPYGYAGFGDASLVLDFTSPAALDPRITFTRASTATYFNSAGVLSSAAINEARFDYDPVTLAPKGLLIEESRTNLVTYSEQFDNAAWTKTRASITADAAVSPDGTMDGDKIIADTSASTTHLVSGSASVTSGTSYTLSVFAKAAEYGFVRLGLSGFFTIVQSAIFSLSDGSIGVTTGTITTTSQNIGNGWWRFSITSTATGSGTTATQIGPSALSSTGNFTGDGTSGIYLWGAQLEAGAFATSYIPTVASQVTRASDLALMTGTNFSSWYNATEGTWFADFTPLTSDYLTNKNLFLASDGTTSNFNGLRYVTSGSRPGLGVTTAGTTQASIATTAMVANTAYKMAGAYKLNDFAVSRNGAAVVTDASGTIPTVTQAEIGSLAGSVNVLGSQYIRRLAYYNRRLSNAELQGITA